MSRVGRVERTTKETSVLVEIDLDGTGKVEVSTGVGFYDHMLDQLGRHGLFDLTVKTEGDLHIDTHHTIEDTALALGAAFKQALGDKVGIYRFGNCTVPLDESLAQVTVDLSGRPYLVHTEPENMAPMIGSYDTTMTRHILESFVAQAQIALHVHVPYGRNAHHIVECQFKALARALRYASRARPACRGHPPVHEGRPVSHERPQHRPHRRRSLPDRRRHLLRQAGLPKGLIALLSIAAAMCLVAGVLRLDYWNWGREQPAMTSANRRHAGKKVVVFDYGFGNVRSAERALARAGADVEITRDFDTRTQRRRPPRPRRRRLRRLHEGPQGSARRLDHRPPPGRRPPRDGHLRRHADPLRARHRARRRGRGPRRVARHGRARSKAEIVPHMGWNTVQARRRTPSSSPVSTADARFYFVHSYAVQRLGASRSATPTSRPPKVTWATHGEPFVAAVENGALWATQFHPEKSGDAGAQLLTNWIGTL